MKFFIKPFLEEPFIAVCVVILLVFGVFILNSLSPELFPQYYIYIIGAIVLFYIFYLISFDILKYLSSYFYAISLVLLIMTLVIGHVTRGTVRWIPLGSFSFQSSEIIRPFLILFFAYSLANTQRHLKAIVKFILLAFIPIILIAIQPSFGVSLLTSIGVAAMFSLKFLPGKKFFIILLAAFLFTPVTWHFLKPYQKDRVMSFFKYENDPSGSGYNTIQSIISTGSGGLLGRGFKKGFQTQLKYLPEKHTDFVFAGISEELGFVGSIVVLGTLFALFYRISVLAANSGDEVYTLFTIGSVIILLAETAINVGMNLGILPITGIPLPLVSAGGSSLASSFITISLLISGKKKANS